MLSFTLSLPGHFSILHTHVITLIKIKVKLQLVLYPIVKQCYIAALPNIITFDKHDFFLMDTL